jgi:ligand-binding SRPBCC domain-containing protein
MRKDARIDYRIAIAGVPLRWRTRISQWEPGRGFVDEQESGPYALWEHTHRFEPTDRGILVTDRVRYALPFGPLGRLAHALWVHSALARIFDYRFRRVRELLEPGT